jgi:hypothetical protein
MRFFLGFVILTIAAAIADGGLSAQAAGPLTQAQRRCAAKYDQGLKKLTRVGDAAFAHCLAAHAKGTLGGRTLAECIQAPDDRLDAVLASVAAALARRCAGVDQNGIARTPDFGTIDPPTALDLATVAVSGIFFTSAATFGDDVDEVFADFASDRRLARCQLVVNRRQAACRNAYVAAFAGCARRGLRGAPGIAPFMDAEDLATCVGNDPRERSPRSATPSREESGWPSRRGASRAVSTRHARSRHVSTAASARSTAWRAPRSARPARASPKLPSSTLPSALPTARPRDLPR